jgi:hypothetical protein
VPSVQRYYDLRKILWCSRGIFWLEVYLLWRDRRSSDLRESILTAASMNERSFSMESCHNLEGPNMNLTQILRNVAIN